MSRFRKLWKEIETRERNRKAEQEMLGSAGEEATDSSQNYGMIAAVPELLAALKPFAALAGQLPDDRKDESPVWQYNDAVLTFGDFRRAAAALERAGQGA
jgi:hypothetical protein